MVGLTVSSNGATTFTENFSSNTAGPNMTLGSPWLTATASFAGSNFASTNPKRIYLGTNDKDYNTVDFLFTTTVTLPSSTSADGMPFFGMGTAEPTANFGEPRTNQHLLMGYRADERRFQERNNALPSAFFSPQFPVDPLAGGTHGMRMEWTASTQVAIFTFDAGNDGIYNGVNDFTFTRNATANCPATIINPLNDD